MENFNGTASSKDIELTQMLRSFEVKGETNIDTRLLQRWKQPWYKRLWTWLKAKFTKELTFITRDHVLKLAEEMYLRGYITKEQVIHLETNLSHTEYLDPALLFKVKLFAESGEWRSGHPLSFITVQPDSADGPVLRQGNIILGYVFGQFPAIRTKPLKGSKAVEQQLRKLHTYTDEEKEALEELNRKGRVL